MCELTAANTGLDMPVLKDHVVL